MFGQNHPNAAEHISFTDKRYDPAQADDHVHDQHRMLFPALYAAAETSSRRSQRRYLIARGGEYAALALAACVGLLDRRVLGGVGPPVALACLAAALAIQVSGAADRAERRWYEARAAAESIKSASWEYAVGGQAFPRPDSAADPEADAAFTKSLKQILDTLPNLDVPVTDADTPAITGEMRQLRAQPLIQRAVTYRSDRVQDQLRWYANKANQNRSRAQQWRAALISIETAAVVLGGLRALGAFDVDWLSAVAAIAASVAAWRQTKDHTALAEAYAVTSHEVHLVADTLNEIDELCWAKSVHDAEAAFSREHTLWLARRQHPRA